MPKILYEVGSEKGEITWAAAEQFTELEGTTYHLNQMEAVAIEKLDNLSFVAKLLLSAVAGAVIQHLLDKHITPESIFDSGTFILKH